MDWGVWKTEERGHMNSREENVIPSTTQNALLKWQFTQKKEIRLFTQFHVVLLVTYWLEYNVTWANTMTMHNSNIFFFNVLIFFMYYLFYFIILFHCIVLYSILFSSIVLYCGGAALIKN